MATQIAICILAITCAFVASQPSTTTLIENYSSTVEEDSVDQNDLILGKPRNLSVLEFNAKDIRLSWIKPEQTNGHIDGYYVYYKTYANYRNVRRFEKLPPIGASIEYTLDHLKPNTEYTIYVQAFSSRNEGEASNSVLSRTDISGPTAPTHFNVTCNDGNSMNIWWERPRHFFNTIDYYYIYIYLVDEQEDIFYKNYSFPTPLQYKQFRHTSKNLTTNSLYKVKVSAASYSPYTDRIMKGQISEAKEVYVNSNCDLMLSKPRNLLVLEANSRDIRLNWSKPEQTNGRIDGYVIYYRTSNYTDIRTIKTPPEAQHIEYTLKHLEPNTDYEISVKAFTSRHEGEVSNWIKSRTDSKGLSAPRNLNVVCQAQNTIFMQWERPLHFFNTIDYYYINIYLDTKAYQNYTIRTSQEYLKVSFSVANVTTNRIYKVQVTAASYSHSTGRALLHGQVTEAKEVYVQLNCDKLQQYNMRHATVCSELTLGPH